MPMDYAIARAGATAARPLRPWICALALAALAHAWALWWATARPVPATPTVPDLAALAVRMMSAPAPAAPSPPLAAAPTPSSAATPKVRATGHSPAVGPTAALPRSADSESAVDREAATPSAEPGPGGTGFRPAGPRAAAQAGAGGLDLNLNTNTYTHAPSLAERAGAQLETAPARGPTSGSTRMTERRGGAAGYSARVGTPLGEYCLRGKDPATRGMSDRPIDNTLLPSSCD